MKRKLVLFLAVGFLLTCTGSYVYAQEQPAVESTMAPNDSSDPNYNYALELAKLKVFTGTGNGFELNRQPTRAEGAVMFVRLLGKEEEALANNYHHPFTDVQKWADPYVGYLYENGLTTGIGGNKFGSNDKLNLRSYLVFVLRCLGYSDNSGDFSWDTVENKASDIKLIDEELKDTEIFKRSELAKVSVTALNTQMKDSDLKLIDIIKIPDSSNFYRAIPVNVTGDNWLTNFAGGREQSLTIQVGKLVRTNSDFTEQYVDIYSDGNMVTLAANGASYEYYEGTSNLKRVIVNFYTGKKFNGTEVVKDYSEGTIKLVLIVEYDKAGNGTPTVLFHTISENYLLDYPKDNYYTLVLDNQIEGDQK